MNPSIPTAAPIWTAFVRSDVYTGSADNEDGEPREELAFYVVCEDATGRRFASRLTFTTTELGWDAPSRATAFCMRVTAALASGASPVGSDKWVRAHGAYGSAAWTESDALEDEARDLEMEAGPQEADRFRREVGL